MNINIDFRTASPMQNVDKSADDKGKTKELKELRQSCREFEAIYINEIYKAMRKTVPESEMFEDGMAEQVYREMLDMEMARHTASGPGMGIGQAMYEQLYKKYYEQLPETE